MPPSSSSPRRAERNVRLDPMGIYGTRSERRRQQLQRRRQYQNGVLWLLAVVGFGFGAYWLIQPHPTSLRAGFTSTLPFQPASAPIPFGEGKLLVTSQSGGLWKVSRQGDGNADAQRFFATAFAPGAQPLPTSKTIFWPGGDGVLRAIDLSGKARWARALPSTLVARPAVARTASRAVVAVGDDEGNVGAFDAVSGAPLWTRALGGGIGQALTVIGGKTPAFIVPTLAGPSSAGGLVCLDATTGAGRWRFPASTTDHSAGIAAPVLSNGRVYWCNDEGAVMSLDAVNGHKIWKSFAAPKPATQSAPTEAQNFLMLRGAPVVIENVRVVVVGGNDGLVRAFNLETGGAEWSLDVGGPVLYPSTVVDFEGQEALLVSGSGPGIFLVDPANGHVIRHWATPYNADFGVVALAGTAVALDAEGHLQGATLR